MILRAKIAIDRAAVCVRDNRRIVGGFRPALNLEAGNTGADQLRDMLNHAQIARV